MDEHEQSKGVNSDETLFAIIECLRELDAAGVTEIACRLNLAKSTVYKHLWTMEKHGYVVKRNQQYRLGLRFLNFGVYVRAQHDVYHAARSRVEQLSEETGEMCWCFTQENGRGVFLCGFPGEHEIDTDSLLQSTVDLHCTAGGKAILSRFPSEAVEEIIERYGLPKRTENTLVTADALYRELESVRQRGYAINREENLSGIHAVAAPVVFGDEVLGSLTVVGAANRLTIDYCENTLAPRVSAAANDVEVNLLYG